MRMPNTVCSVLFIEPRETQSEGGMEITLWDPGSNRFVSMCMYVFLHLQEKQAKRPGCSSSCCAASPSVAVSWRPVCTEGCRLWRHTDRSQRSIAQSDTSLKTTQSFRKKLVSHQDRSNTFQARRKNKISFINSPIHFAFHLSDLIWEQKRASEVNCVRISGLCTCQSRSGCGVLSGSVGGFICPRNYVHFQL